MNISNSSTKRRTKHYKHSFCLLYGLKEIYLPCTLLSAYSFIILGTLKPKNYCWLYVITSRPRFSRKGSIYTNNKELLLKFSSIMGETAILLWLFSDIKNLTRSLTIMETIKDRIGNMYWCTVSLLRDRYWEWAIVNKHFLRLLHHKLLS